MSYQERDREVVDYRLWDLPGIGPLRGPRVEPTEGMVVCLGAAQTFGPLCDRPFPQILAERLGRPVLNLGVAGAGPRWFLEHPRALDLARMASVVVVQVMSGRSEDSHRFRSTGTEWLTRTADGVRLGAATAWAEIIRTEAPSTVLDLVAETRANWVESHRRLFAALDRPTILFWFSQREPDLRPDPSSVENLFGGYPQLIDTATLAAIEPLADEVVRCVTSRGMPQPLFNRWTGEPVTITGRADLGSRVFSHNHYYPSPEMHEDAAAALQPALERRLRWMPPAGTAGPAVAGGPRDPVALTVPSTSGIRRYADVLIVPYRSVLASDPASGFHTGGPIWPDWDERPSARHHFGGSPVDRRPEPAEAVVVVDEPLAWVGPVTPHFGHQVGDFSMRLLATRVALPDHRLVVGMHPVLADLPVARLPAFWRDILHWFGHDPARVRLVNAPILARELAVAPQAEQVFGPGPDPAHLDAMDELVRRNLGVVPQVGTVYVSRAGVRARLAGERYLEEVLAAQGIRVVRPETLPLADQLRIYLGAERLIIVEGAVLHGMQLLGRLPAPILAVHRRPGLRVADENVRPRVPSLEWVDAIEGLVCGLRPTGGVDIAIGITAMDPDRLVDGLRPFVPRLAGALDARRFREAQETDMLDWCHELASRWRSIPGALEQVVMTMEDAGMGRLVRAARRILA